ncbi:MAG: hypothetical protein ACRD0O_10090, partial [Acidimicrobiia bacterium]
MSEFRNRLLAPFGVTLVAAVVIVVVVFNLSQVLLALEQEAGSTAATVVAVAGASVVLLGAVWSVSRRRPGSWTARAVLLGSGLMLIMAGSVSYATLEDGGEHPGEPAQGGGGPAQPRPPIA